MRRGCLLVFTWTCFYAILRPQDSTLGSQSAHTDSLMPRIIAVKHSWFLSPIASYREETSVGLGVVGGYYMKSRNPRKIGSVSGSFLYTFLNQAKLSVHTRFYTPNERFMLAGSAGLCQYPDFFYGIGNEPTGEPYAYTSQSFQLDFQPAFYILPVFRVGAVLSVRGEQLVLPEATAQVLPELEFQYGSAGWNPYLVWGLGAQVCYDTRDNPYYPQQFSHFVQLTAKHYNRALGSSYTFTSFSLDVRQYVPTWVGQVFAWQLYVEGCAGLEIPFRMLPTLGGSDNLRGFRERVFTDNLMFEIQTEYRIPIWSRLKGAVFCSVGDVVDMYHPQVTKIKVGYGAGLRFRLNPARVNIRVDVAGNNYGEVKFCITASEAF